MGKKTNIYYVPNGRSRHDHLVDLGRDIVNAKDDTGKIAGVALAGVALCAAAISVISKISKDR